MLAQVAIAVTLLSGAAPLQPDSLPTIRNDPWVSPDKAKHFLVAGFVESATFAGLEVVGTHRKGAFIGAFGITAAVSVLRELHNDRARSQFSYKDLTWDALGGIAAFLVLRQTERP